MVVKRCLQSLFVCVAALTVCFAVLPTARGIDLFGKTENRGPLGILPRKDLKSTRHTPALVLQQEMMDFSDRYTMAVWQAADEFLRTEEDPEKRLRAETFKVLLCSASMQIAAGRDPAADMLDMYVFVSLSSHMIRERLGADFWSERYASVCSTFESLEKEIQTITAEYVGSEGLKELDSKISDWVEKNPNAVYISEIRLRDFTSLRAGSDRKTSIIPLLSETQKAVGNFEEALHTSERLMFYIERLPRMATMQSALTIAQTSAAPSLLSLSRSAATAAIAIDTLPEDIQKLADSQSETLRILLPQLEPHLDDLRATVESWERITARPPQSPDHEPWTPEKTGEVLDKAHMTLGEINKALAALNSPPDTISGVSRLVSDFKDATEQTMKALMNRALILAGFVFLGALGLLIVAARLFKR